VYKEIVVCKARRELLVQDLHRRKALKVHREHRALLFKVYKVLLEPRVR
jgi:hypothetical protein